LPPLGLIIAALVRNRSTLVGQTNEMVIAGLVVGAGVALYFLSRLWNPAARERD
jgi:hypothetical protein